jgi:branched-chain amino acid aminotransferase
MPDPLVYLTGRFLPQSQAALPLYDAGFVLGATVTDLCRTFRHQLYRWNDHLARFRRSCQTAFIAPPLDDEEITARAFELVRHNAQLIKPEHDLALVLFATPGPVGYYLGDDGSTPPTPPSKGGEASSSPPCEGGAWGGGAGSGPITFGMHTFPLPFARYRPLVERGASLVIPGTRQVPASCVDPHIKQRSRMHWWLAERQVQAIEAGATALLLDTEGQITETASANFLLVRQGMVLTPPRERILEGISLQVVQELCSQLDIRFAEQAIVPTDILGADEGLLTSTPYCLAGVSRCQGQVMPWPGPIFRHLLQAWNDRVGLDIHGQILSAS